MGFKQLHTTPLEAGARLFIGYTMCLVLDRIETWQTFLVKNTDSPNERNEP